MCRMKKATCLFLILFLVFSVFGQGVFGIENEGLENKINDTNKLKNSVKLQKNDVIKLAKYHINDILSNDKKLNIENIKISHNLINLYDTNENLFAYIVPITNNREEYVGYITVGGIEEGYNFYEMSLNSEKMKIIQNKIENSKESSLIFLPPYTYIIKDKNNKYEEVFSGEDITEAIKENYKKVNDSYNIIKKDRHKTRIENIINNIDEKALVSEINTIASTEVVELDDWAVGDFVPVYRGSTTYYGGNQMWWPNGSNKEKRGCGPVAAANITAYFALKDLSEYGTLYQPIDFERDNFMDHMDQLYNYIDPTIIGEPSLNSFTSDIEAYSSYQNAPLTRVTDNSSFTLENSSEYIKQGLNSDSPVACLNLQLLGYKYGKHWMTITRFVKQSTGSRYITVSNWGDKEFISYDTWFDSTKLWGGGLIYFE